MEATPRALETTPRVPTRATGGRRAAGSQYWRGTSRPLSATEWTARPRYRLVFCRLLPS
jgi:hypothetical protein